MNDRKICVREVFVGCSTTVPSPASEAQVESISTTDDDSVGTALWAVLGRMRRRRSPGIHRDAEGEQRPVLPPPWVLGVALGWPPRQGDSALRSQESDRSNESAEMAG